MNASHTITGRWTDRPTVELTLGDALPETYARIDPAITRQARALVDSIRERAPAVAKAIAEAARMRTRGRFQKELLAAAHALRIDWRWIMVANISYDYVLQSFGCSTVAAATPHGPILARNMDWIPEVQLAHAAATVDYRDPDGTPRFSNVAWPGAVGVVTGLAARGFALCVNAVGHTDAGLWRGYPVLLHLRRVLEDATDFPHAVEMIKTQSLFAPALITVVGTQNHQRVCVERTPTRAVLRWPDGDDPLVTTNDYLAIRDGAIPATQAFAALGATSCSRRDRLLDLADNMTDADRADPAQWLQALSDSNVRQDITAQHIVMRPRDGLIRHTVPTALLEK